MDSLVLEFGIFKISKVSKCRVSTLTSHAGSLGKTYRTNIQRNEIGEVFFVVVGSK